MPTQLPRQSPPPAPDRAATCSSTSSNTANSRSRPTSGESARRTAAPGEHGGVRVQGVCIRESGLLPFHLHRRIASRDAWSCASRPVAALTRIVPGAAPVEGTPPIRCLPHRRVVHAQVIAIVPTTTNPVLSPIRVLTLPVRRPKSARRSVDGVAILSRPARPAARGPHGPWEPRTEP